MGEYHIRVYRNGRGNMEYTLYRRSFFFFTEWIKVKPGAQATYRAALRLMPKDGILS